MNGRASHAGRRALATAALLGTCVLTTVALADEGGVSFWLPGLFGSLAAAPAQPGWSLTTIYYHTSVSAGGDVSLAREFETRRVPVNVTASLNANLNATADLGLFLPSYVFATPVLGGQLSVGMLADVRSGTSASVSGTLSGTLSAGGISIPFMRSDSFGDSVTGFGDLIPLASLKWNQGVHNFMAYMTGDIPVGAYDFDPSRQHRHRTRRDRRRRRLYVLQPADRPRVFGGRRLYVQFRQQRHQLSERCRLPHGFGGGAVSVQTGIHRCRRLCL